MRGWRVLVRWNLYGVVSMDRSCQLALVRTARDVCREIDVLKEDI
jgi:hypothetical protein